MQQMGGTGGRFHQPVDVGSGFLGAAEAAWFDAPTTSLRVVLTFWHPPDRSFAVGTMVPNYGLWRRGSLGF